MLLLLGMWRLFRLLLYCFVLLVTGGRREEGEGGEGRLTLMLRRELSFLL
jgi:hypothetical protein